MGAQAEPSCEMSSTATTSTRYELQPRTLLCPHCTLDDWKPAQHVRGTSLSRCSTCGLLATTHFLKDHENAPALYDVGSENYVEYSKRYLPARLAFYRRILPKLEPFRQTGQLLEIGSSYGHFLDCASAAGWEAQGVEISDYACQVARSRGCRVRQADLLDVRLSPESFDVIAMWDVIEHFSRPTEILRHCIELLRPGGGLILRTPDARALCPGGGLFRAGYRHLGYPANTPEHVFHFTSQDLSALLSKLGYMRAEIHTECFWQEFVISGKNALIRAARWAILRYAFVLKLPYEFVAIAAKPRIS